jgi:hypothetical protein
VAFFQLFITGYQLGVTIAGPTPNAAWIVLGVTIPISGSMYFLLNRELKDQQGSLK